MILKTTIRPDRFQRIISGEKKEHRIPVQHIELGEIKYEVVKFCSAFGVWVLVELLQIEKDQETDEYVLKIGAIKSVSNAHAASRKILDNQYRFEVTKKKEYVQKCEILRDGRKVGILNLSTKQGQKQRTQLSGLQGYSFKDLPLEIIYV